MIALFASIAWVAWLASAASIASIALLVEVASYQLVAAAIPVEVEAYHNLGPDNHTDSDVAVEEGL